MNLVVILISSLFIFPLLLLKLHEWIGELNI